jgi:hypothetical protein
VKVLFTKWIVGEFFSDCRYRSVEASSEEMGASCGSVLVILVSNSLFLRVELVFL